MEKEQKIFVGLIAFIFIIAVVIGIYFLLLKKDSSSDALKFKNEYESYNGKKYENSDEEYIKVDIDDHNLYVYKTDEEIVDILKRETGVIYFGFADCPHCRNMVSILNKVAKDNKLDKIYYVDIANIRDSYEVMNKTVVKITNGTSNYYKILDILDEYLNIYTILDEDTEYNTGVKRLYAPTVVVVSNGEILGFHEGTIEKDEVATNLNEEEAKELTDIYSKMIKKLTEDSICTKKTCKN